MKILIKNDMRFADVNRLVISKDPHNLYPIKISNTAFATLPTFRVWCIDQKFTPSNITHLYFDVPVRVSAAVSSFYTNLQSLTLAVLPDNAVDFSSYAHLTELVIKETSTPSTVILSPNLRVCKLCVSIKIDGDLPVSLERIVFSDDKDWRLPSSVKEVYYTGSGFSELTITGTAIVSVAALYANIIFLSQCPALEKVLTDSIVSFPPNVELPNLRIYIASDVPPPCDSLAFYGLYDGDDFLENTEEPAVVKILSDVKERFAGSDVFLSPPMLNKGRSLPFDRLSFLCLVTDDSFDVRVADASNFPDHFKPYEFVVDDVVRVPDHITVGALPEEVEAVEGEDPCFICSGRMVEPDCPYECGMHDICRHCIAKSKQIRFLVVDGLPGAPKLENESLLVCPFCKNSKRCRI